MLVCNNCNNIAKTGVMKGSGWIELILWLAYVIPGVIYSIWRRSEKNSVCPFCGKNQLKLVEVPDTSDLRDCEWCAEPIKLAAKICKHCKKEVEPIINSEVEPILENDEDGSESSVTEKPGNGWQTQEEKSPNYSVILLLPLFIIMCVLIFMETDKDITKDNVEAKGPFSSFSNEIRRVDREINCINPKITKGSKTFGGDLYGCIQGNSETVIFFINQIEGTNKVKNVKLMWNDWTKNLTGEGLHSDKNLADKWVSAAARLYAPGKDKELKDMFYGKTKKVLKNSKYTIVYRYHKGPAIDERLFTITAN